MYSLPGSSSRPVNAGQITAEREMIYNTHLRNGKLKVLLGDVLPALTQRVHSRLGTNTTNLRTRALTHLLGQCSQVDAPLERHLWEH